MNFRTYPIFLSYTDSDNVSLQLEIDSTHVSHFPFLHSKLTDFELHVELLTNGVERLADTLEDVLDSTSDVCEVLLIQ